MIYVGIDVAKNKHDYCILGRDGEVLVKPTTITNTLTGYNTLLETIKALEKDATKVKVALEATGHYSVNLLQFLLRQKFLVYLLNPLQVNLYRCGQSIRKTKTDRVDAKLIASFIRSNSDVKPYTKQLYHIDELKSLCRYRLSRVNDRSRLKIEVRKLLTLTFPELETIVATVHSTAVYDLLLEYPGAKQIANANLKHLSHLITTASRGQMGQPQSVAIRQAARNSIGSQRLAWSLELQNTVKLIRSLDEKIAGIEAEIEKIMQTLSSPLITIPGVGMITAATIIGEVGEMQAFASANKLLAFAGCAPSTYQSGQLDNAYAKMEKRGSRVLRATLYNTAKSVSLWEPSMRAYLAKKRAEGKHYNVAISHVVKKLVRLIYAMSISGNCYQPTTPKSAQRLLT